MKRCHVALAAGMIGIAEPASACLIADSQEALIHSALPSRLPSDAIVLDVEVDDSDPSTLYGSGLSVRVRRIIQGDVRGTEMTLRAPFETSCDAPLANGSSGIVVGYLTGEGTERTISPVFVQRGDGFQIPAGGPVSPRSPLIESRVYFRP
jgi:hypothetical protein